MFKEDRHGNSGELKRETPSEKRDKKERKVSFLLRLERVTRFLALAGILTVSGRGAVGAESDWPSFFRNPSAIRLKTESSESLDSYETTKKQIAVAGFGQTEVGNDFVREFVNSDIFPKRWMTPEKVDSIVFRPHEEEMPSDYGIKGPVAAQVESSEGNLVKVPFFGKTPQAVEGHGFCGTCYHESGHVNDWIFDQTVSQKERSELKDRVIQRYLSGNNLFGSSYVGSIKNENKQKETSLKITEYWAEIVKQYFSDPNLFEQEYPEDYKIVNWWVKKHDPNFDPISASQKRDQLLQELDKKAVEKARQEADIFFSNFLPELKIEVEKRISETLKQPTKSMLIENEKFIVSKVVDLRDIVINFGLSESDKDRLSEILFNLYGQEGLSGITLG